MGEINFKINGICYSVGCEVSSDVTLLDYIRNVAELRGTKYMCREGGCGACIVSAVRYPGATPQAVNSCLVSVTSCEGWEVTTVEKVGNRLDGYSENGTQCGYCTPGWVMAMHSLINSKKNLTMSEIEKSFGSNVCRCTGYRPILEAFKKFAEDSPNKVRDIEDLGICKKTNKECFNRKCSEDDWCLVNEEDIKANNFIEIDLVDGKKWFKVYTIPDITRILNREGYGSYMLVAGNTAKGVYPILEYPQILIDITSVSELKRQTVDQNLVIGAGCTLTETLKILKDMSAEENFCYLDKLHEHLNLVAHIAVQNIGTIAGNLMIKNQHNEFPSDLFLLFETVGAQLTIYDPRQVPPLQKKAVKMQTFLKLDMKGKIILNVMLPPLNSNEHKLVTFKIMPRSQSAHALVNAGFLYKVNDQNVVQQSRIVYGGLSPSYIRATALERCLIGKKLFENETLKTGITKLRGDLIVDEDPVNSSVEFRTQLALNLFYKGLLILCPASALGTRFSSGAKKIHDTRPVSEGRQIYDTNKNLWPLNKPVQKLEALIQCSGEAKFTEDIPTLPNEVFIEFALSTVATGNIISINPKKALNIQGVIAFYTAKDIPGLNSFTPAGTKFFVTDEEILCNGQVKYFNQPIGVIVAESRAIAERAARMVEATYSSSSKLLVIDIKKAKKDSTRNTLLKASDATDRGNDVTKVIRGDSTIYYQYHFHMETLVCVTKPSEFGLSVHVATQYIDAVQLMIAKALNMDENSIDIKVLRLGGAYGVKISRVSQGAIACSLVSRKLNRPCRFIQSLRTNMRAVGKRLPCSVDFEVGVNDSGVIQYNNYNLYEDNGYLINEPLANFGTDMFNNCYDEKRWNYKCYNTVTDTPRNTFCRSPGTMENVAMAELLMERIAYEISKDPLEVRLVNLSKDLTNDIKPMLDRIKINADYNKRRENVDNFNSKNRWTKRGLRLSLLKWILSGGQYFDVILSIYHGDGTVAIAYGGIEMGQGINTKAAQVCAYLLKIPLDKVKVKGKDTTIAPNSFASGGSITSQNVTIGVRKACEEMLKKLQPTREQMDNPTWEALVAKAFSSGVDLQTKSFINDDDKVNYNIYGVALAETEVDILTGQAEILRVDIVQDVGQSINPVLDIGQIEGAFIMGLGYWMFEDVKLNPTTGEVLTDRTWNYFVPQARDIPQDFRVYFRQNSYTVDKIFGAKGTGEPPICLSVVIALALREALTAARADARMSTVAAGSPTTWFDVDGPWTVEKMCLLAETKPEEFKFI